MPKPPDDPMDAILAPLPDGREPWEPRPDEWRVMCPLCWTTLGLMSFVGFRGDWAVMKCVPPCDTLFAIDPKVIPPNVKGPIR